MTKFRAPRKLYYYDRIGDEIVILKYHNSHKGNTYHYFNYLTSENLGNTVAKNTIVFLNHDLPPTFACSYFTSQNKCRQYRRKVLEEKIEKANNAIRDNMSYLDLYTKRLETECEVV